MGVTRRDTTRRWSAVAVGVAVVVAAPSLWLARPVPAAQSSASALLRDARASATVPYQGLAESRGSLGLPDLPRLGPVAALLGSTTRARVWWRTSRSWRVDTLTSTGESGTYAVARALHTWDYETGLSRRVAADVPVRLPRADDLLPPQAARRLLSGAQDDIDVRRLPARRVAGHAVAGVRVVPRQAISTIGHADVWVEPRTGLPLALDVYPRGGGRPVLTSRFLDLSFRAPSARVVDPNDRIRARGLPVAINDLASALDTFLTVNPPPSLAGLRRSTDVLTLGGSATFGRGLARVVVLPLPGRLGLQAVDAAEGGGGAVLDVAGLSRAVLVATPLLTVVVVHVDESGREATYLLAGTVTVATLQTAVDDLIAAHR